jgi:hypothetical protein
MSRLRTVLNTLTVALPPLSGFAFFWWLEWSPKTWADPECGIPRSLLVTFVPFFAIPPLLAGIQARRSGKGWAASVGFFAGGLLLTAFCCVLAFLVWFGKHKCGE